MAENITVGVVFSQIFLAIWNVLDVFFSSIELFITQLFSYIPPSAIQFLIGILCYSLLAFLLWSIDKAGNSRKRLGFKFLYRIATILMILFTLWRMGFVAQIASEVSVVTISQFLINLAYVIVAIIFIVAFFKKIPWLKKFLLIFLWVLFTLFTFIVGPYLANEITLSSETLVSYLVVVTLFMIPNAMNEYRKMKRKA